MVDSQVRFPVEKFYFKFWKGSKYEIIILHLRLYNKENTKDTEKVPWKSLDSLQILICSLSIKGSTLMKQF